MKPEAFQKAVSYFKGKGYKGIKILCNSWSGVAVEELEYRVHVRPGSGEQFYKSETLAINIETDVEIEPGVYLFLGV